jgi:hypothetical protein
MEGYESVKFQDKLGAVETLRVRTATSDEEYEQMVAFYEGQLGGDRHRVMYRGADAVLFKQRTWGSIPGHIVLFIFTFWTFGLVNIFYAFAARQKAGEVIVRRSSGFSPDFEVAWQKSQNKSSDVFVADT